jgi:riboflavin-specific deaminase-like protein
MFVFSNLATSLDGKIATASRALLHLGTPADRAHMQILRKRADVLLMGAGTLRACRMFCGVRTASPSRQIANAILSTNLDGLDPKLPFFADPTLTRILFATGPVKAARRRALERSSEIVMLRSGGKEIASEIIEALTARGFRKLLIEGGGSVMWDFAARNRIDEYHVTLTPKIIGGVDAPTLVDGEGFGPQGILPLRLSRCRRVGDELYLTYKRKRTAK